MTLPPGREAAGARSLWVNVSNPFAIIDGEIGPDNVFVVDPERGFNDHVVLVIRKCWIFLVWKQTAVNKLVYIIPSNSGYRVDVVSIVTRNICSIQVWDSSIYLYY